jgi:hypothetical protein
MQSVKMEDREKRSETQGSIKTTREQSSGGKAEVWCSDLWNCQKETGPSQIINHHSTQDASWEAFVGTDDNIKERIWYIWGCVVECWCYWDCKQHVITILKSCFSPFLLQCTQRVTGKTIWSQMCQYMLDYVCFSSIHIGQWYTLLTDTA